MTRALTPQQSEMLALRREGKSYREIAAAMDITRTTARDIVYRAESKLALVERRAALDIPTDGWQLRRSP
jgi:DNA-binding CsgD family transcriptional regulator